MFSPRFMKNRHVKIVYALLACFLLMNLTACHSRHTGSSYSGYETRQAQRVQWGTIEAIDYVIIDDQNTGLGAVGGAFAGGALGSLMGRGSGHVVGAVVGSIAGAAIGYGIEDSANKSQAVEYTVKIKGGERIAVVQAIDTTQAPLREGDRVRVLTSPDGTVRVRP